MKTLSKLIALSLIVATAVSARAHEESSEKQKKKERLHASVQQICPVSGQRLGDHGVPIKVTVGEKKEEIYLCCQGCLKQKINPKHWATIHANMAKAQGKCPVMEKPLPKNPKWTIVNGRIVYVCCPPCTDKIDRNPDAFLKKVDTYYTTALQPKATIR